MSVKTIKALFEKKHVLKLMQRRKFDLYVRVFPYHGAYIVVFYLTEIIICFNNLVLSEQINTNSGPQGRAEATCTVTDRVS